MITVTIMGCFTRPPPEPIPRVKDFDQDGLDETKERELGTSDYDSDSDDDGLDDGEEYREHGTDPKNPDTDGDGFRDGDEVEYGYDPNKPTESIIDGLQPIGSVIYSVKESSGTYSETTDVLTYSWKFLDENGFAPSTRKYACVTPTELPDDFWENYDDGSVIINREQVDKKWRNLYIQFTEEGIISFQIESDIPGEYGFRICGILDENYTILLSYAGDGDEIIIEVPEPEPDELIVIDKGYEEWNVFNNRMNYGIYWTLGYLNGSEFTCGHLGSFPYENMTTSTGSKEPYLFEIIKQQGNTSTSYFFLSSVKYRGSIQRSDTWTLKGPCGCASAKFNNIRGSQSITITIALAKGETATVSIGAINENYFTYKGDGDPITVIYTG